MPYNKIKRLFRVMPWLLALVLTGVFVLLLHYEWRQQDKLWRDRLGSGVEMLSLQVNINRWHLTRQAVQGAELIAANPQILATIRTAYDIHQRVPAENSEAMARIRAELERQLQPYWRDLQALNARYLQISLAPDATVLLRMHRPERFGDRQLHLRPLVMEVLTGGSQREGMEVSRHGAGYRGVAPVFAQDNAGDLPIAAIEVGVGLLAHRPHAEGSGRAIVLAPELLNTVLWDRARAELTLPEQTIEGHWLLESFSDDIFKRWYLNGLLPDPSQPGYRIVTWQGKVYLIHAIALRDFQGDLDPQRPPVAAIYSWQDISNEHAIYNETRRDTLVKWLFALLLAQVMMLLLWHFTRRYIRALIDEHRIQLEQERDSSETARQRLMLALASSDSGFWEWDIVTNKATFSLEWKKICGVPTDYPVEDDGEEWLSRLHPHDKEQCVNDMTRHIKGETPMFENEHRLRIHDGTYKWFYTRGKVVEWLADGRAARMLGVYTDISSRKHSEITILRQQAALRALNDIASLPAVEFEEQLRRSLILGARHLGMHYGIISRVKNTDYAVVVQISPDGRFQDEQHFPLQQTPCSITLADGDVVAVQCFSDSPFADHPAHTALQLQSYIGVPLWVEGDVYGTVSFSCASAARATPFDAQDKDFMRLLARWMGSVITHWQQDDRQRALYRRFTKLSDRLPGFLYQFQLNPDGSSFFPYASAGIKMVYGVNPAQASVNADAIYQVIHPDDREAVAASVNESAITLSTWRVSYRVNHPQRGLIWVQGDAQPEKLDDGSILWHGFISDVTAAKDAEQRLQETNELRQAIFDAASVAIISVDEKGLIKTFNRGAENMLGYTAEEVVGKHTPVAFHLPEEMMAHARAISTELNLNIRDAFEAYVAKARRGEKDENEWTYVRRDGSHIPVLLAVTCLRDAQGDINGFLGIARDITELKRTNRLKSEFISTVSHELRTPLTAISGSLGLIVGGATGELPPNLYKMINIAHKNSLRLNHLVNDLLDMEKLVAGKMHFDMRSHELVPLIQQALEENTAYAAQHQVSFQLQGSEVNVQVVVDATRFLQVLTNFLSNAAKFSPPGSVVKITVSLHRELVRVAVSDNGGGIPEEFRSRIFQKFSQADSSDRRQKGGTGLGLAICKELVERMGGSIGFESVEGMGSTFYFDLPCVNSSPVNFSARAEPMTEYRPILVVEDNHEVADLIATMLRNAGYQVDIADRGATALLSLSRKLYGAVTLDLMLPDMSGLQVLQQIRARKSTADIPVVVVSAAVDEGRLTINSDLNLSHVDWLEKPINETRLLSLVKEAVSHNQSVPIHILHIEDDVDLQRLIAFIGHRYAEFDGAASLAEAREKMRENLYQLVILDLGLPDGNGWDLLPELREHQPAAKIIVLSSSELNEAQKQQIEMAFVKNRESSQEFLDVIESFFTQSKGAPVTG